MQIETARLTLRQPWIDDALAIFERYASDPEVTRFLGFVLNDPPTRRAEFPNLAPGVQQDALCYVLSLEEKKGNAGV